MTDAKREKSEQRGEIIPTYPTIHAGTTKLHSRGARRRKSNTAGPAIEPCPSRIVVSPNPISPTARPLPSILHHSHTRLSHSNGRARRRAALGIYSKSLQPDRLICARARSPYTYTQRKRKRSWRFDPASMCPKKGNLSSSPLATSAFIVCMPLHRVGWSTDRPAPLSPRAPRLPLCCGAVWCTELLLPPHHPLPTASHHGHHVTTGGRRRPDDESGGRAGCKVGGGSLDKGTSPCTLAIAPSPLRYSARAWTLLA